MWEIPFSPQWWASQAEAASQAASPNVSQARQPVRQLNQVSSFNDDCRPRERFGDRVADILNKLIRNNSITINHELQAKTTVSTRRPTIYDDSALGYIVGSWWYCTTDETFWMCVDATIGLADWRGFPTWDGAPSNPTQGVTGNYTVVTGISCSGSSLIVTTKQFTFTSGILTGVE